MNFFNNLFFIQETGETMILKEGKKAAINLSMTFVP